MIKIFEQVSALLCKYEKQYHRRMAITYALTSQIFFISMFTCVGLLRKGYTTQQIVQGRMFIGYILNYFFCRLQKISIYPTDSKVLKLMVLRGVLGAFTMLVVFQSFKLLNMSDAIVVSNTNPIWTAFLASYFLGEKLTRKSIFFCVLSFIGIVLIVRPAFIFGDMLDSREQEGRNQLVGCAIGLLGSVLISCVLIIVRKMQHQMKCNNAQLLMFSYIFTCIISGIVQVDSPNNEFAFTPFYFSMIVIIGLTGFVAQLLYSRSFSLEEASVISPLQYTEVIFSFAIDIFFFGEQITITSVIGSVLVVVGSVAILI